MTRRGGAVRWAGSGCRIEVIDTLSISMGLGLIVMAAARLAKAGENLQRVLVNDPLKKRFSCPGL